MKTNRIAKAHWLAVTTLAGMAGMSLVLASPANTAPRCSSGSPPVPHPRCWNWRPPDGEILAQQLLDRIMATHPELLSLTFHGVPPGTSVHTMFAGSFPHRIGDADDLGDLFTEKTKSTILDPSLDQRGKFVVFIPLRDAGRRSIGAIIIAFKDSGRYRRTAGQYYHAALALRNALQKQISGVQALFGPAPNASPESRPRTEQEPRQSGPRH
ncbi:MAG: hypothetical protein ACREFT_18875 [Acetobacteraceae bacterium]